MKKLFQTFLFCLGITIGFAFKATAQAPQAIPYQAIARNSAGDPLISQTISLRLSIRDLSAAGTILYQESHTSTTTPLGLFVTQIGQGTPLLGTFSAINWAVGSKFLQVEMDITGGTNYTDMGSSQLMSVPYALHAGSSSDNSWQTNGNAISNTNSGGVGIGITSPDALLHLHDVTGTQNNPSAGMVFSRYWINPSDTRASALFHYYNTNTGNDNLAFGVSGGGGTNDSPQSLNQIKMMIQGDGKVGIGSLYPKTLLDVRGDISLGAWNENNGSRKIGINDGYSFTGGMEIENTTLSGNYSQKVHFITHHNYNGFGRRMTINEDGFVGIATETPSTRLDVTGFIGSPLPSVRFHQHNCGDYCAQAKGAALQLINDNITTPDNGARLSFADPINITNNDEGAATIHLVERDQFGNGGLAFSTRNSSNILNEQVRINKDGNVGIGTSVPAYKLSVAGHVASINSGYGLVHTDGIVSLASYLDGGAGWIGTTSAHPLYFYTGNGYESMAITTSGDVGIGTSAPAYKLQVSGSTGLIGSTVISPSQTGSQGTLSVGTPTIFNNSMFNVKSSLPYAAFIDGAATTNAALQVEGRTRLNGTVAIGSTANFASGYQLSVGGKIICTELRVQATPFPDYVFASDYKLKSLDEVEEHINTYHRLPNMPAATEVEAEGMSVGGIQLKLVEKVEELTLYMLQQQKQITKQQEKIEQLEQQLTQANK